MKIPMLKIGDAKAIFRSLEHDVHDFLSPCCKASMFKGVCMQCGKPVAMPYYFVSLKPVDDEFIRQKEIELRSKLPVGMELCAFIP